MQDVHRLPKGLDPPLPFVFALFFLYFSFIVIINYYSCVRNPHDAFRCWTKSNTLVNRDVCNYVLCTDIRMYVWALAYKSFMLHFKRRTTWLMCVCASGHHPCGGDRGKGITTT